MNLKTNLNYTTTLIGTKKVCNFCLEETCIGSKKEADWYIFHCLYYKVRSHTKQVMNMIMIQKKLKIQVN